MPKDPFKMTKEQFDAEMEKITSGEKSGAAYAKGINPKPYDVTAKRRKLAIKKNTDFYVKEAKPSAEDTLKTKNRPKLYQGYSPTSRNPKAT